MKKKKKKYHNPDTAYRQRLYDTYKSKYPNYNLKSNLIGSLFLVGIALTVWEINIYRETFISVYIPLSIWVLTGLIITPFFKKTFNIYCFNPYTPGQTSIFWHLVFNIVSFGGMCMFLFMWTNQSFCDQTKKIDTLQFSSTGHLAKSRRSCGNPYAYITYQGVEKQLVFDCGVEIEKFNQVYIEVQNGFWGYKFISNKTLIEGQW